MRHWWCSDSGSANWFRLSSETFLVYFYHFDVGWLDLVLSIHEAVLLLSCGTGWLNTRSPLVSGLDRRENPRRESLTVKQPQWNAENQRSWNLCASLWDDQLNIYSLKMVTWLSFLIILMVFRIWRTPTSFNGNREKSVSTAAVTKHRPVWTDGLKTSAWILKDAFGWRFGETPSDLSFLEEKKAKEGRMDSCFYTSNQAETESRSDISVSRDVENLGAPGAPKQPSASTQLRRSEVFCRGLSGGNYRDICVLKCFSAFWTFHYFLPTLFFLQAVVCFAKFCILDFWTKLFILGRLSYWQDVTSSTWKERLSVNGTHPACTLCETFIFNIHAIFGKLHFRTVGY